MTGKQYIINSESIEDTDANVLEWVNKYVDGMKACEGRVVFMRVPLQIERGVKSFDPPGTFANVYARWSVADGLLQTHSSSCSNQNVLNPFGAYIGVEECGCRTPPSG
jgi:hypothetical protein